MRAVRFHGFGDRPKIEDVPDPVAGPEEVVIRVKACQLGTDVLKIMAGTGPVRDADTYIFPHTPGYRGAGIVETVQSKETDLKPGDRVIVNGFIHCRECEYCRRGLDNLCTHSRMLGVDSGAPGALAEKFKAPAYAVFKLPDSVSFMQATLFSNIGLLVHALERAKARAGFTVAIVGCGLVGSCAIPVVRAYGATQIIGIDTSKDALDLARKCGADSVIASDSGNVSEKILELTGGQGVDVAIELVGLSQTIELAIHSTAKLGKTILLGALKGVTLNFPDYYNSVVQREIDLVTCFGKTRDDFASGLRLAQAGQLELSAFAFQEHPMDGIEEAIAAGRDSTNNKIQIITM